MENVATPPETDPAPSVAAPSLNVTVPVGAAPPVIVAVNVTLVPKTGDDEDVETPVPVEALATVTPRPAEDAAALFVSPP